jgi:hypothetical protein
MQPDSQATKRMANLHLVAPAEAEHQLKIGVHAAAERQKAAS